MSIPNNWAHDESVRAHLAQFLEEREWTHARIASRLGFTASRITKYLNLHKPENKPEADAPRVEAAAKHFLRHQSRQSELVGTLFENEVSRDVANAIRQVRRTGDIGLLYSRAGRGKTCGALLYCTNNPNTLFITVRQYASGANALRRALFQEYSTGAFEEWPGNLPRAEWLERELKGAERLIIFDDAELLHISGFRFAFSLHDATGSPMIFIGNREILTTLRRGDSEGKLISRVGLVREIAPDKNDRATATELIKRIAPESGNELIDAATDVVSRGGHVRRLKKQLLLAVHFHEGARTALSWEHVFTQAGKALLAA